MHAVVYTRSGCHLCDDAIQVLMSRGLTVETRDIDQDEQLLADYNECVPVVQIDGKVRFRGKVNLALLDRLIAAGA